KELLPHCDQIVIARGDLGNAMPLWGLPAVQKSIQDICKEHSMPYMVVTQMLDSMMEHPIPTRAEVSDVFHAVYHGASSIMLTGETAAGKYPLQAMEYFCETAKSALSCKEEAL
ncbi:MAG: pyruvate kinase, partial [Clostridium sp.]|nr:pyruvate kinase [Clostridium sp.]